MQWLQNGGSWVTSAHTLLTVIIEFMLYEFIGIVIYAVIVACFIGLLIIAFMMLGLAVVAAIKELKNKKG